jgi:peptidoglycan/xylan/chitin deacetylase (PgdA/CDA1 family)
MTARWVSGIVGDHDPRKVAEVVALQPRPIDQTSAPLEPFNQPIITITFDDGWESVYTNALPTLQRNGLKTTQYLISGVFDNPSYMSIKQIQSMQKAGHEVGAHTASHADLTQLDEQQLTYELVDSQKALTKHFGAVVDFTSPYGAYNAHTLKVIGQYYRSQKNAEGDPAANELEAINIRSGFNALNIKSYSVRKTTTPDDLRKLIKAAQDHNGWLILTYHQVDDSEDLYAITPVVFEQQMELVKNSDIRSATVGEVFKAVGKSR